MNDLKSWRDPLPDGDTLVDVMLNHGEWVIGMKALAAIDKYQRPYSDESHGIIYRWRIHNAEA